MESGRWVNRSVVGGFSKTHDWSVFIFITRLEEVFSWRVLFVQHKKAEKCSFLTHDSNDFLH